MVKDIHHDTVKNALEAEGWHITHDPLTLKFSKRRVYIDLGAERLIAADKGHEKIAVEIKSFIGLSILTDFYKALGQYQLYILGLKRRYPDRELYLAIPEDSYVILQSDDILAEFLMELQLRMIIFNPHSNKITSWIK